LIRGGFEVRVSPTTTTSPSNDNFLMLTDKITENNARFAIDDDRTWRNAED
jgi:hypothetical protein